MHRIIHRVNTVKGLSKVPKDFGVEVDIRSEGKRLIMHHDPFEEGESFTDWLNYFNHGTLILNVKEEGLEKVLIDLMESKKIRNYKKGVFFFFKKITANVWAFYFCYIFIVGLKNVNEYLIV